MIRRTFSLSQAVQADEEEFSANPMESVANLSDVMLVLAVALMVALVSHWGVSMSDVAKINESNMQPIEADMSSDTFADEADGETEYEEVGTVYKDKETGELYVVGGKFRSK